MNELKVEVINISWGLLSSLYHNSWPDNLINDAVIVSIYSYNYFMEHQF